VGGGGGGGGGGAATREQGGLWGMWAIRTGDGGGLLQGNKWVGCGGWHKGTKEGVGGMGGGCYKGTRDGVGWGLFIEGN